MFFLTSKLSKHGKASSRSRISEKGRVLLLHWAAYLQRRANRLPLQRLRFFLFVFCLLSAGICSGIIIHSVQQTKTSAFPVTPIHLPVHILNSSDAMDSTPRIENEWQQVQQWHQVLDSLRRRALYNQFRLSPKALLDSLHQPETRPPFTTIH